MYIAYIMRLKDTAKGHLMHNSANTYARTQIYLSAAQQQALNQLALQHRVPKSELIRRAVDGWLTNQQTSQLSKIEMLRMAHGAFKDRADLCDAVAHVDHLRQQGAQQREQALQAAWGQVE